MTFANSDTCEIYAVAVRTYIGHCLQERYGSSRNVSVGAVLGKRVQSRVLSGRDQVVAICSNFGMCSMRFNLGSCVCKNKLHNHHSTCSLCGYVLDSLKGHSKL